MVFSVGSFWRRGWNSDAVLGFEVLVGGHGAGAAALLAEIVKLVDVAVGVEKGVEAQMGVREHRWPVKLRKKGAVHALTKIKGYAKLIHRRDALWAREQRRNTLSRKSLLNLLNGVRSMCACTHVRHTKIFFLHTSYTVGRHLVKTTTATVSQQQQQKEAKEKKRKEKKKKRQSVSHSKKN